MQDLLLLAIQAARMAGREINRYYRQDIAATSKEDGSPITIADQISHRLIIDILSDTDIDIVSEEGTDLLLEKTCYWLVDPLDGTKDFMAANDEFTINIALIIDQKPVMGVVFAPALDDLYYAAESLGAWREYRQEKIALLPKERSESCRMAISRFHNHPDIDIFARDNAISEHIAVGSALKYAYLAAAKIDVFPRLVGSSEWDTAAGQAILESAGGAVLDWHTGLRLSYGKEKRRNPRLLALRAPYQYQDFYLASYPAQLL